jgi:hypothetical protein
MMIMKPLFAIVEQLPTTNQIMPGGKGDEKESYPDRRHETRR